MHEIAHIVLDHSEESELAETEVKFFAKYALAPPVLIDRLGLESVPEIAEAFDISYEAAKYALNYYEKWSRFGPPTLTEYEKDTVVLFRGRRRRSV